MRGFVKEIVIQWLLLGLLVASMVLAVSYGSVSIPISEVWQIIGGHIGGAPIQDVSPAISDIIWNIRLPRVILAACVGAGLALAGLVMQASVQNPLAEPFILGIASGASVGAVVAILLGAGALSLGFGVAGAAFLGALLSTLVVLLLAGVRKRLNTVRLILAGAVVSALCVAVSNCIIYMAADAQGMQTAAFWTMGSLADAKWSNLFLPVVALAILATYFLSQIRTLDALLLGEEVAVTLGINASKKRRFYMSLVALLTGVLVSQCGVIGFVGLVIPHMVRALWGASHRAVLPLSILLGAIFLVWADLLSRIILPSGDLPIGIITALLGAPLFMYLLFAKEQGLGA